MSNFTRSFLKIIPTIREATLDTIAKTSLKGEKILIPTREGTVEVFLHSSTKEYAPVVFEFHGGGFVLGDARKDDTLREVIKDALDINVVGVNYRKAPEYPYPAAVEDAYDVIKYFYDNAKRLQIDKEHFITLGFSAGATLATVMAILASEKNEFQLAGQVLHYPYLDAVTDPHTKEHHPEDLPEEVMEAFIELYSGKVDLKEVTVSPIYATKDQLSKVAKAALFMASEDALCLEGILYASQLRKAGVEVFEKVIQNTYHGYMEDLFNRPCYEELPDDTKKLHAFNIDIIANESMKETIEVLRKMCFE